MTRDVKTEKEVQNVLTTCKIMYENNIGCIVIINQSDNNNTKPASLLQTSLRDIMSKPLINVSINSSVRDAIQPMQQKNIRRIIVSDGDEQFGIITDKDIFRTILNNQDLIPILLDDKLLVEQKRYNSVNIGFRIFCTGRKQ